MTRQILVLGAMGMLGKPVTHSLQEKGHRVHVLVRDREKASRIFGRGVEIFTGSAMNREDIREAMAGCEAVHINLTQEVELTAVAHVLELAAAQDLNRVSYVSATTACEENRWFDLVDVKMRAEERLRASGLPYIIFCPTWVMETLSNFIHEKRAVVIHGRNPPPLHFFAAADFGRMVAAAYEDDRALGKRLFIHGPEAITLPAAIERFAQANHPHLKIRRLSLRQARFIARLTRREKLAFITKLIAYFDEVGELGDPAEANALLGAPAITLDQWLRMAREQIPAKAEEEQLPSGLN